MKLKIKFQIFKKEGRYRITYRVDVIIGFSYSEYTYKYIFFIKIYLENFRIKFGKIINATGKYLKDESLFPLDLEEIIATLLSISIGNSENKFAVFIDELNDVVYDYSKAVLATLGEGNIKEILNKVELTVTIELLPPGYIISLKLT